MALREELYDEINKFIFLKDLLDRTWDQMNLILSSWDAYKRLYQLKNSGSEFSIGFLARQQWFKPLQLYKGKYKQIHNTYATNINLLLYPEPIQYGEISDIDLYWDKFRKESNLAYLTSNIQDYYDEFGKDRKASEFFEPFVKLILDIIKSNESEFITINADNTRNINNPFGLVEFILKSKWVENRIPEPKGEIIFQLLRLVQFDDNGVAYISSSDIDIPKNYDNADDPSVKLNSVFNSIVYKPEPNVSDPTQLKLTADEILQKQYNISEDILKNIDTYSNIARVQLAKLYSLYIKTDVKLGILKDSISTKNYLLWTSDRNTWKNFIENETIYVPFEKWHKPTIRTALSRYKLAKVIGDVSYDKSSNNSLADLFQLYFEGIQSYPEFFGDKPLVNFGRLVAFESWYKDKKYDKTLYKVFDQKIFGYGDDYLILPYISSQHIKYVFEGKAFKYSAEYQATTMWNETNGKSQIALIPDAYDLRSDEYNSFNPYIKLQNSIIYETDNSYIKRRFYPGAITSDNSKNYIELDTAMAKVNSGRYGLAWDSEVRIKGYESYSFNDAVDQLLNKDLVSNLNTLQTSNDMESIEQPTLFKPADDYYNLVSKLIGMP